MKEIRTTKILSAVYDSLLRDKIRTRNQILAGPLTSIGLQFNSREDGAYTTVIGKSHNKLLVVIGGGLVSKIAKLPSSFTDKATFKPYFDSIISAFYGLDYHEMGHVLFTDMKDTSISQYPLAQYRGFLHSLFNIIEDPIIEINMCHLFQDDPVLTYEVNPEEFFDFMRERVFFPQADTYKDDGTVNGFMNYLLVLLRCGKSHIKNNCAVFDKYSSDLLPQIKDILYESNPTERIHKTVKLGEWIIENIKEFNWELPVPEDSPSGRIPEDGPSIPGGCRTSTIEEGEAPIDKPASGADDGTEEETESDEAESKEEKSEEEGKESSTKPISKETPCEIEDELDDVFNDIIHDGDDHEWIIAKDEYEITDESVVDDINDNIEKFTDCINDVSKFLTLFKGRIKPREFSGFTRGKLNVFRAMQDELKNGCDTKLFNQKVSRGQDKDLAVSLLCDNSGSMSGTKSVLCAKAAVALAQACEWAGIPFECNCFTKTEDSMRGTCLTIKEKSFDDSFESSKPYFAINDSYQIGKLKSNRRIPTFCGNSEEINLYYIWKKFARVNHKTKLLFVFCDGATTGSKNGLSKIVRQIEDEDGIIVVGIGICCTEVASIYPHHKLFNSASELESGLAQYLIDTLSDYAV